MLIDKAFIFLKVILCLGGLILIRAFMTQDLIIVGFAALINTAILLALDTLNQLTRPTPNQLPDEKTYGFLGDHQVMVQERRQSFKIIKGDKKV